MTYFELTNLLNLAPVREGIQGIHDHLELLFMVIRMGTALDVT